MIEFPGSFRNIMICITSLFFMEIPRNVISATNFIAVPINDNSFPGKLYMENEYSCFRWIKNNIMIMCIITTNIK